MIVLLFTLPLAAGALYMWAIWSPVEALANLPVALVNSDVPAGEGAAQLRAGDQVVEQILETDSLDWKLVDAKTAIDGVRAGDYYFAVEIPPDFSSTLSSIGTSSTEPASLKVTFNDNTTTTASNLGGQVATVLQDLVRKSTSASAIRIVLDGLDQLGTGLADAADGSRQLSAGTGQLSDGVDQLADGINDQLAPGSRAAAEGGRQLADGAGQLSQGLADLQTGTDTLGVGSRSLSDGIATLADSVDPDGTLLAQVRSLQSSLASLPSPAGETASSALDAVTALLDGVRQLETGSAELTRQLTDDTAEYRSGINAAVAGGVQVSTGADQLAVGLGQLDTGVGTVTDNLPALQDGARQVDEGATTLADSLTAGAAQIPDLTDAATKDRFAEILSTPVATDTSNLSPAGGGDGAALGPGAVPPLLAVLSALVPILAWMVFRPVQGWAHSRARILRRFAGVSAVTIVAVVLSAAALWSAVSPQPEPSSMFKVVLVVTIGALTAVSTVGASFRLLGYVGGAAASLAFWMMQLFAFGGVWMIEAVPAPMRVFAIISPLTYVREGLIAAFNGTEGLLPALGALVGFMAAGAAIQLAARRRPNQSLHSADQDRELFPESVVKQ